MEKQFKYIYKGNEVSKEEFTNVAKEMFKWFENNTINAVDYSSVSDFLDGDYKSKGELNKHLKGVLGDFYTSSNSVHIKDPQQWKFDELVDKKEKEETYDSLNTFLKVNTTDIQKSKIEGVKQKFTEAGAKAGEKHNKIFLQSYNNLKDGEMSEAYKETEGKLFYELDWGFITQMAERMASNKKESKYNLWNWKKPMTLKGIEDLKQATLRHLLSILDGVYEDDGREFGHIEAVSDGMMMINYQLKNNLK